MNGTPDGRPAELPSEILGVDESAARSQGGGLWWLAALLLPVLGGGIGLAIGLSAPANQNDWFGMRVLVPILFGLLAGCVLSCGAAVISLQRDESLAAVGLMAAIPAFVFLVWSGVSFVQAKRERARQTVLSAANYQEEEAKRALMTHWQEEIKAHPALITDDEFWRTHNDPDHVAQWGMNWALQEKTFVVTPEIKAYVIKHFPREVSLVFSNGRSSPEELQCIVNDRTCSHEVRETALDCLLRNEAFEVPNEMKRLVNDEFPQKYGLLWGGKKFTRSELEELVRDPKIADHVKRDAAQYLKSGTFKKEAAAVGDQVIFHPPSPVTESR